MQLNQNCLAGLACPSCGIQGPFEIEAQTLFCVTDDGTEVVPGPVEWTRDSFIRCLPCDYCGKVGGFELQSPCICEACETVWSWHNINNAIALDELKPGQAAGECPACESPVMPVEEELEEEDD